MKRTGSVKGVDNITNQTSKTSSNNGPIIYGRLCASDENTQTVCLNFIGDLPIQQTNEGNQLCPSLVAYLFIVGRVQNGAENRKKIVEVRSKDGGIGLEEMENGAENGTVLEVIVLEGKGTDENGKDLVQRNRGAVLQNHAGNGASGVVLRIESGWGSTLVDIEERSESSENVEVLGCEVGGRVFDQDASGEGSVAKNLSLRVTERGVEQLEEDLSMRGDGLLHSRNDFGEASNCGRAVAQRLGGFLDIVRTKYSNQNGTDGVFQDERQECVESSREIVTQGVGQRGNQVSCRRYKDGIVLSTLFWRLIIIVLIGILLADSLLF